MDENLARLLTTIREVEQANLAAAVHLVEFPADTASRERLRVATGMAQRMRREVGLPCIQGGAE